MNMLKIFFSAVVGGFCGAILWIVVSVPACIALSFKHGGGHLANRQAEAEVNGIAPLFTVVGLIIGLLIAVVDEQRKMANRDRLELVQEGLRLRMKKSAKRLSWRRKSGAEMKLMRLEIQR